MPDVNTCVLTNVAGRIVDQCIQAVRSSTEGWVSLVIYKIYGFLSFVRLCVI